jgi:hypothetical protein
MKITIEYDSDEEQPIPAGVYAVADVENLYIEEVTRLGVRVEPRTLRVEVILTDESPKPAPGRRMTIEDLDALVARIKDEL